MSNGGPQNGPTPHEADDPSRAATPLAKLALSLLVLGVFGLAGPPAGGVVAWLTMGAASLRSPAPFITGSYAEGLTLALGTGLLVAIAMVWYARSSWLVPVAATLVVNVAFHTTTASLGSDPVSLAGALRVARAFLPSSLAAALFCWLISRWLVRAAGANRLDCRAC